MGKLDELETLLIEGECKKKEEKQKLSKQYREKNKNELKEKEERCKKLGFNDSASNKDILDIEREII